jgi:hypothetical protein
LSILANSRVFEQIDMDVNSPMEDVIGGIVTDFASDIRLADVRPNQAELDHKILTVVRREIQTALDERSQLIKYIVVTAESELLEQESPYEKYFVGHIPQTPPYNLLQNFERIMGHATEAIINGVVGNLSELGFYNKRGRIIL